MSHKNFLSAFVIFLSISMFSPSYAADTLTLSGNFTLITSGRETQVNGTKNIPMPKPFFIETQDDHPSVLADVLIANDYPSKEAAITIKTSEPFTVNGKALLGIFTLKGTVDNPKLLSIGKNKRTLPPVTKDYYLAVEFESDSDSSDDDDDEVIDAATLYYLKLSVQGSESESPSKYPAFAHCTGDNVRLRDAPGTKSRVIGKLDDIDSMTVFDEKRVKGDIWYLVEPEGQDLRGWIIGRYVKIE